LENASKALIMAAVILISVVILSLAVYLFTYFGSYSKGVEEEVRDNQIAQFNSQFLSYDRKIKPVYDNDGNFKKNVGGLTIYDVITLANLAREYNKENELVDENVKGYIKFHVNNPVELNNYITSKSTAKKGEKNDDNKNNIGRIPSQYIYDDDNELLPYSCKIETDNHTSMVSNITIKQE